MPPKFKFTREEILSAAVDIVRSEGESGLTARALATRLGTSVKPIFGQFKNMDELRLEVKEEATRRWHAMTAKEMERGEYPKYKASGMAYVRFAAEEPNLFLLIFMRNRGGIADDGDDPMTDELVRMIAKQNGLSLKRAWLLHLETWIYVHGIASMIATGYLNWDMDFVSDALSDCYLALRERHIKEEVANEHNKD